MRGDVVTDGPFAETKEALGGYYLIEATDLDQALAIAKLCPAPYGGVEVRPILDLPGGVTAEADGPADVEAAVADAHRREWGFVLAATVRVAGSIDLAEECVQDAYGAALDTWRRQGVPRSPGAWLTTTARRRALDVLRREQTLRRKLPLLVEPGVTAGADEAMVDQEDERDPRRPAAAGLHLLPPGPGPRGAGRADAAAGVRADHGRDRRPRSWSPSRPWRPG